MNAKQLSLSLNHFSWEEWDNRMIAVLFRSDRRFVVKRYIERVLSNSSQWQKLAQLTFSKIEPIVRTYKMTENEMKLMHEIFSWHLKETLKFPIVRALDQLLDWEDVLDFLERAQHALENDRHNQIKHRSSPSIVPTIPIGISTSKKSFEKIEEKHHNVENLEPKIRDLTSNEMNKEVEQKSEQQQHWHDENKMLSSTNHWVQINNICVPYIIKSQQSYLLPYQVLVDCNLLNEQEQSFLLQFTTKATSIDIETFENIISTSSSIDFTLPNKLLLIDLYDLIFGMSKVVYVKLVNNQRSVNKRYKTVLAQNGGTAIIRSRLVPFISLGKRNFILLNSLLTILELKTSTISILQKRSLPAHTHEIDYLHLVQFYQRTYHQTDHITLNQQQQQLLVNIDEVHKYVDVDNIIIDMPLVQYQQVEFQKLSKQIEMNPNKPHRKSIKRKANIVMTELQNGTIE